MRSGISRQPQSRVRFYDARRPELAVCNPLNVLNMHVLDNVFTHLSLESKSTGIAFLYKVPQFRCPWPMIGVVLLVDDM